MVLSNSAFPVLVCENVSQDIFDVNFENASSVTKADILEFFPK